MKEKQYIAPMDLFGGKVKKGDIFKNRCFYNNSWGYFKPGRIVTTFLPAEIVETWEEYIEDPFKDLKEAFEKGAIIEYYDEPYQMWIIATDPSWNKFSKYRIKPEPKYIPFTWEDREELRGKWLKRKDYNVEKLPTTICNKDVMIGDQFYSYKELLKDFTFLDGTPCGKLVKE